MAYRYATERVDHTDLASGYVLRSVPGQPGFPARLASELFQRSLAHLDADPVGLWDPCCGGGHLAAVLALLHRDRLAHVHASDVDGDSVRIAARNLDLLTERGMAERERELRAGAVEFAKPAFSDRAEAARRLAEWLRSRGGDLRHSVWEADAFAPVPPERRVDLVLTDVPYGNLAHWAGARPAGDEVHALLRALSGVLPAEAVLTVTARARRVDLPRGVRALERVRVGNRAAVLVRAGDLR
ncbi:rRNA methyltransferase [Halostreptopolyspora alba]|uniref:rRNA methyltransferase n=1 Tax=Halostreptopolyspora alba TaxID=2487137 RepID=A0A3N0E900_9ACTN|nr:rRNA methyltransferase [Nocardiopsaceae bacterium YIM 96095]